MKNERFWLNVPKHSNIHMGLEKKTSIYLPEMSTRAEMKNVHIQNFAINSQLILMWNVFFEENDVIRTNMNLYLSISDGKVTPSLAQSTLTNARMLELSTNSDSDTIQMTYQMASHFLRINNICLLTVDGLSLETLSGGVPMDWLKPLIQATPFNSWRK